MALFICVFLVSVSVNASAEKLHAIRKSIFLFLFQNNFALIHTFIHFRSFLSEMGQTLSEPVTTKQSATCADSQYMVASSCMQGWRISKLICIFFNAIFFRYGRRAYSPPIVAR